MTQEPEHSPTENAPGSPILSWQVLLARWTRFAQAALAMPPTDAGDAWRGSVESIITLQAVTFALGDLMLLSTDERALAVDRAGVLIATHERNLEVAWRSQEMPPGVGEIMTDARRAHSAAKQLLSHPSGQ